MKEINTTAITEHFRKSNMAAPHHYNQSMMFRCTKRLNPYTLKSTMRMLSCYHEALRSFWNGKQLIIRDMTCLNLVHVEEHDLRRSADVNASIFPVVQKLQSTIDLSNGPLVHVGLFHLPEYDAVFMAIHHLVVDGVSWRIIAEDLNGIYPQFLAGSSRVSLPKIRCTFAEYAEAVHDYAVSDELLGELPYWTEVSGEIKKHTDESRASESETAFVKFSVEKETTQRVLTECIGKYGVNINDLLLTALSRAWKNVNGQGLLSLSMEGHGREPFGKQALDLERIVGWLTTIFPVLVDCSIDDVTEHVKKTSATMSAIPNKGFGYGTLLHIAQKGELECFPQMTFNYLGSFEEKVSTSQMFAIDNELPKGDSSSPLNIHGGTPLSINCLTVNGCLEGTLGYDKSVLDDNQAQTLIAEFSAQLALL